MRHQIRICRSCFYAASCFFLPFEGEEKILKLMMQVVFYSVSLSFLRHPLLCLPVDREDEMEKKRNQKKKRRYSSFLMHRLLRKRWIKKLDRIRGVEWGTWGWNQKRRDTQDAYSLPDSKRGRVRDLHEIMYGLVFLMLMAVVSEWEGFVSTTFEQEMPFSPSIIIILSSLLLIFSFRRFHSVPFDSYIVFWFILLSFSSFCPPDLLMPPFCCSCIL